MSVDDFAQMTVPAEGEAPQWDLQALILSTEEAIRQAEREYIAAINDPYRDVHAIAISIHNLTGVRATLYWLIRGGRPPFKRSLYRRFIDWCEGFTHFDTD